MEIARGVGDWMSLIVDLKNSRRTTLCGVGQEFLVLDPFASFEIHRFYPWKSEVTPN